MKKLTITIALTALLTLSAFANPVDVKTAQKVATTFLNNNGAKSAQLTDLSKAAGFPNLYIFSTESSFVVMAADDCAKPILGYSLSDKFSVEDMPENLRWWLQGYSDEIQWGIENNIQPDKTSATEWQDLKEGKASKDTPSVIVDPLLTTTWNQRSPYNNYCPIKGNTRTVTGCVATAMAQIMKYWEHPTHGIGYHSYTWNGQTLDADFGATTYDWADMNDVSTNEGKDAVATLMYHCGVSVEMNYNIPGSAGSNASTYDVISALQTYFNYAPYMQYRSKNDYDEETWITILKLELEEGRPLQYRGNDAGGEGGHSFVCDGYDSNDNFHFNWGWGGYCDGYYSINNMNPNPDASATGAGNGVYTVNQAAIFGIEPTNDNLMAPTISATATNGSITLEWDAIENADSYDIYKDMVKIATVAENHYTDDDVFSGTYYEYYVRAVSGDTRSNPSNHVTKLYFYRDYTPVNLTTTRSGSNAILNWEAPENNSVNIHYGEDYLGKSGIGPGKDTYWAEVFASSRLTNYVGMRINMVSTYLIYKGEYKLIIYEGDPRNNESIKLLEQEFTNNTTKKWKNIEINNPIAFNCSKELWIILFCPATNTYSDGYPASAGPYDEIPFDDETNDERYNPRRMAETLTEWGQLGGGNYSWLIRTYLTDGTYTYNIYDGESKLNSESITSTTFTHENPITDATHHYTVTTNYYGGESEASNMAGLALGTTSLEALELGENDKMIVTENSTLTVTETLSNDNPENLILENGAQLFHSGSDDVYATVKKDIAAYTTEKNGWNFIASPIATQLETANIDGLIPENEETTFDLYKYNEPNHKWYNYKPKTDNAEPDFAIDPKTGYLYASSENTTLSFAGKLHSASSVSSNTLSYSADVLKGFNLVGNPFVCNATLESDFYVINDTTNNVILAQMGRQIAPCESVFVQATEANQTVTFSKAGASKGGVSTGSTATSFDLVVTQGKITLDRARVRLGEETGMEKFTLDSGNSTQLTLWHDGQDYAVAYTNGQSEMPLNFKAVENGTYSIGIESNSLDLDYLHLIDNMTGDDVDLLALEPVEGPASYTFEAKTTDYASRFRLVFAPNCGDAVGDDGAFAYVSNGEIVVVGNAVGDAGTASLQVVDMTGRVVVSVGGHTRCVPTTGIPAGVYVLRLIDGHTVRTQKIVIE